MALHVLPWLLKRLALCLEIGLRATGSEEGSPGGPRQSPPNRCWMPLDWVANTIGAESSGSYLDRLPFIINSDS